MLHLLEPLLQLVVFNDGQNGGHVPGVALLFLPGEVRGVRVQL